MPDKDQILVENLRETLKQVQRYLIFGLGSSLILLSIIIQSPGLLESEAQVSLPFIGQVIPSMAAFTLIIAGFAFGAIAVSGINRVKQIVMNISDDAVASAAITFPSLVTLRSKILRSGIALSPMILLLIGFLIEQGRIDESIDPFTIIGIVLISSPYFVLAYILWKPIQVSTMNDSSHLPQKD